MLVFCSFKNGIRLASDAGEKKQQIIAQTAHGTFTQIKAMCTDIAFQ